MLPPAQRCSTPPSAYGLCGNDTSTSVAPSFSYSFRRVPHWPIPTSASSPCPKNSFGTPIFSPFTDWSSVFAYCGTVSFTLVLSRCVVPGDGFHQERNRGASCVNGPT